MSTCVIRDVGMTKYSKKQVVFHWLIAVMIATQFIFHDAISDAYEATLRGIEVAFNPLVAAHVFVGITVLLLSVWRFAVRQKTGVPPYPEAESKMTKLASEIVHYGTYALAILLPISGGAAWFGGIKAAAEAHEMMKAILMALVALHIGGALFHLFAQKNNIFKRMWF